MSNFECTVTIADIYGAEWWDRNKAELEREWEWSFGWTVSATDYASCASMGVMPVRGGCEIRIILHRRKLKPPTLREVYGADEVKIPAGWEWTGEWRLNKQDEWALAKDGVTYTTGFQPRLILRERAKKVWFKAEDRRRNPRRGEWNWDEGTHSWRQALCDFSIPMLCATHHEEADQTVQVVTQADVDKVVVHA